MRNRYILVLLALSICSTMTIGQERYLDMIFDQVEVQKDVTYGANFTVIAVQLLGTSLREELKMDIYQPVGDTIAERPLVIMLHTGNFLPLSVTGLNASRTDSSVVEVCNRLARMGYVVASASYRTGWNPFAESATERTLGLINAAYRGLQDSRTCIRYFKRDKAESGDSYRIDTSRIVMWGQGTGGYISQAAATIDKFEDVVTTTMPVGKFTADLNADGVPDPMIIPAINGDIYGTSVGLSPGGTIPAGDTLCRPNHVGYSSDFQMCVNMGGALGDISWLDEGDVPMIAFHVPLDQFAPYESKILDVPSPAGALPVVEVQGSKLAIEKAASLGNNDVFASVDDETTDAAKAASDKEGHDYLNGLYPFHRPANTMGRVDGSPWNWWEPSHWDTIPSLAVPALTFHQVGLLSNPMSPEKGRAYIDTIMAYFAPRAVLALGLGDTTSTSVQRLDRQDVGLVISPNPSKGFFQARSLADKPMQQIRILDYAGRTLLERRNLQTNEYSIDHTHLPSGLYLVEIRFKEGRVVEKIAFE